jgi:hypothetical protein
MLASVAIWVALAGLTSLYMAHRGHSWFSWAILALALGPLSWPLAARAVLADARPDEVPRATGDVLVAVPPWVCSPEPVVEAVRRADLQVGEATLVSVLEAEDAQTPAGRAATEEMQALLVRCGEELLGAGLVEGTVEHYVLFGRAADELARLADAGPFRAIVLGPAATWGHHLVQGHTGHRLRRLTAVPVLLAGPKEAGV